MGDIQEQTVAGAIQTGTHGTGRDLGGIAAQVTALEMVLADGSIVSCSADREADLFQAARIGLGALGVLTAVTLRVVPAFLLTAREEPMAWAEVIARLDELTSGNEHFEFYWFPHTDGCLTKRNNRSDGPARPLPRWRHQLDDEFLSNTLFGATCRLGQRYPAVIPAINGIAGKALSARTGASSTPATRNTCAAAIPGSRISSRCGTKSTRPAGSAILTWNRSWLPRPP
jgi:hypothetical protein